MRDGLRIKEAAGERGITLSSLAKRLGIQRSNMSAIASGARGVSLKTLKEISCILDCSLDELILAEDTPVFKNRILQALLEDIQKRNPDGTDKTWVHRLRLAQAAHYRAAKRHK